MSDTPCFSDQTFTLIKSISQIRMRMTFIANRFIKQTMFQRIPNLKQNIAKRSFISKQNQNARIQQITGRQIYDSRGNPTIEVDIKTEHGIFRAGVPSGASTGIHEVLELRDNNPNEFHGKGVSQALSNINNIIAPALIAQNPSEQLKLDTFLCQELDGSYNNEIGWSKTKLGANAIIGVSLAIARAGAAMHGIPLYQHIANISGNKNLILPVPSFNVINGGSHAGNPLPLQEFMILPTGADSFKHAMQMGSETYHHLKNVIRSKYGQDATNVGDEGGFAPHIRNPEECMDMLLQAIKNGGYEDTIEIAFDAAASEFCVDKNGFKYNLNKWVKNDEGKDVINSDELCDFYINNLINKYPIILLEDGHDEDDWKGFENLTGKIGDRIICVGDDLLVTNPVRIKKAIEENTVNGLLLKVNQIGTLSESIEAVKLAKHAGWSVMTSHRSGETEDSFIADMTVGLATGIIKSGAPCRSERLAKYNQFLRIEEELGNDAVYAGKNLRFPCDPY
eukprot:463229_1